MEIKKFKDLSKILENKIPKSILKRDFFTSIIGTSPSKGARSPILWNSCYKKFNLNAEMIPMDVSLKNLPKLMSLLKDIDSFQGGSCTVPHKEKILKCIDFPDEKVKICGATNCFYKENSKFSASNTDGDGAILALSELSLKKSLKNLNFLIIGFGGAGKAISASTALQLSKGQIFLSNRTSLIEDDTFRQLKRLFNVKKITFPPDIQSLRKADVIINATSIGFKESKDLLCFNPISVTTINKSLEESIKDNLEASLHKLQSLNSKKVFFDVIYQPSKTFFLLSAEASGHKVLGGLKMNLYQAVLGFLKVNENFLHKSVNFKSIKKVMESA